MPLVKSQQTKEVKYYIKTLNHNFWLCIDGFCQPNIVWKQDKTCATKFLLSEAQSLIKALEPFANISQICIEPINKVWYLERRHAGYNYVFEGAGETTTELRWSLNINDGFAFNSEAEAEAVEFGKALLLDHGINTKVREPMPILCI